MKNSKLQKSAAWIAAVVLVVAVCVLGTNLVKAARNESEIERMSGSGMESDGIEESGLENESVAEDELKSETENGSADGGETAEASLTRIWGPVLTVNGDRIHIDNRSGFGGQGEIVLMADPELTRVVNASDGLPADVSSLTADTPVFAYILPQMMMSEPPVVSAELILCDIPADLRVPDYVHVRSVEQQPDGSYLLESENGMQYLVPEDCEVMPYRTRNIVTLADITQGSACVVWSDEHRTAQKILLFAA